MAGDNPKKPNTAVPKVTLFFLIAMLLAILSCRQRTQPAIPSLPSSNDYLELTTGQTLHITVPYLSSGGYTVKADSVKEEGNAISVSGAHLVGFQVSRYAIQGPANGKVQFRFKSAETTIDGKSKPEEQKPALPFALPRGSSYARLIYFVRSSHADHNMAIVAAKTLPDVNAFTTRLISDPSACEKAAPVFCVWVPLGIAVKQE